MLTIRNMNGFDCKEQNSTNPTYDLGNNDGRVTMLVFSIISLLLGLFGNIAVVAYNICLNRDCKQLVGYTSRCG